MDRILCIDVLFVPQEEDEYKFAFLPESKIGHFEINDEENNEYWVKVSTVFEESDVANMADIIDNIPDNSTIFPLSLRKEARKTLSTLYKGLKIKLLFCKKPYIN